MKSEDHKNERITNKSYYDEVTITVDKDGGEVEVFERKTKTKVQRDRFIAMYLKDIQGIINLTSKAEFQVLMSICGLVEYNTNEVILVKARKEQIARKTGLSYSTVHNTISRLSKKNVLIRKEKTIYILNPDYFFKGQEIARAKVVRHIIEYTLT